ncbi:MAG: hypothetical protein LH609_00095, partial [Rudanella sp.]|nr:hypothetical protein [Rudanella sp.]
ALYLPLLPEERNRLSESEIDFRKALEKEALRITGNSTDVKTGRIARYTPSGRITMTDNRLGIIGVEGVRVRANRWFTTHEAITDVNGFFMMDDTFDNPCNYSIKWERADFDILEGGSLASFQAYYNGPKQSGSWNLNIDGGQSLMYAAIHRAAIRYFYKNNDLRTPRNGSFWSRVSIAAYDWESPPSNGSFDADGFQTVWLDYPDIRIYRPSRGPYALYSTAIHELAHASHWAMDRWNNRNSDKIINESWARCVQWHFTSLEYGNNWDSGIQYSNPTVQDNFDNVYTPIFIDLIDNVNQAGNTYFSEIFNQNRTAPAFMVDNVNGYSIRQLEDILVGSRTMLQLRDNLRDAYVNPTEGDLNQLFASYGFQ